MVKARCFKEKKDVEIKDPVYELNAIGRPVVHGKCASCGTRVYKLLAAADTPADLRAKMAAKKGGGSHKSKKSKSKSHKKGKSKKSKGSRKSKHHKK